MNELNFQELQPHHYTANLNSVLDKMFEYLGDKSEAKLHGYKESKLRAMMDYLQESFMQIDQQTRGYCYGWEIMEYFRNNGSMFSGFIASGQELSALVRFAS